jgi:hypothetical protein
MDLFLKNPRRNWSRGYSPSAQEIEQSQLQLRKKIEEKSGTIFPIVMTAIVTGVAWTAWRLGIVGNAHRK